MPKRLLFIIESLGGGGAQNALSKLISEFQNNNLKLTLLTFKSKKYEAPSQVWKLHNILSL